MKHILILLALVFSMAGVKAQSTTAEEDYQTGVLNYTAKSYKYAFTQFEKAADQGHANAQYYVGYMYYSGEGVDRDFTQAAYWWKKASLQGHANAQYYLGYMYYNGEGVPQSLVQAHMWFNISNANGPVPYKTHGYTATYWRDIVIAKKMSVAEKAEAQRLAVRCDKTNYENCGY